MAIYILNIETATKNCSVSIAKDGKVLSYKDINTGGYSHAEQLHLLIEALLNEENLTFTDLTAIAVGKGPGSFTGLRIGISAAKGLCFALNIPLISLDSLLILANSIKETKGFVIPMIDARRMEVYTSVYTSDFKQVSAIEAKILEAESFNEFLDKSLVYFVGDGIAKFKAICTHKNARFIQNSWPSAKEMGKGSFEKYKKSDIEDVAYFEPFYLKDFLITKSKK